MDHSVGASCPEGLREGRRTRGWRKTIRRVGTDTLHRDYAVRAAQAGVQLMIAYRLHFEPATLEALEVVRRGEIGDPRVFSSVFGQQVRASKHRTKAGLWAGPLPDMGCYPLNAVRHLFGAEPIEAIALAGRGSDGRFGEVDEAVSVVLRFPDESHRHLHR